ncbi:MAG: lytic transglycosylase domain-containing protein [Rhizobiaceae bacterium]|nr:lytic transglycosylase domain-containing protein [Rhizobiaceae bacterium]
MVLPETVSVTPESFAPDDTGLAVAEAPYESGPAGYAEIAYAPPPHASPEVTQLIEKYAVVYEVPSELVRRVVRRESNFRPGARNGPYWGLMQIRHDTARGMGYDGPPSGLLDAETNLKYAVKYLRGAYVTAEGNQDQAVRYYARGYYYDAKRKGLLEETGLVQPKRKRLPETMVARADPGDEQEAAVAVAAPAGVAATTVSVAPAPGASPTAVTAARAQADAVAAGGQPKP